MNIKGVFNTSNETKYEKEASEGIITSLISSHLLSEEMLYIFVSHRFKLFFTLINLGVPIDFKFYKTLWSLQVWFLHH